MTLECLNKWIWVIYVGQYISIAFLAISYILFMLYSELRRLHGKSMEALMINLCFTYISNKLFWNTTLKGRECVLLGISNYFLTMSSVFWFSAICIKMYRNFRNLRRNILMDGSELQIWHGLYAVLCPAALTIAATFFNAPQIRENCWFTDSRHWVYFYNIPIKTIAILNAVLFLLTSFDVYKLKKELEVVINDGRSHRMDDRQRQKYRLYRILWGMMGLPFLSTILVSNLQEINCFNMAIIAFNTYHGLSFFIIFFCYERVRNSLLNLAAKFLPMKRNSETSRITSTDMMYTSFHSADVTEQIH